MASPAEIMQPLPDTLPEDFSEWDGESSSATRAVNPTGSRVPAHGGATPDPSGRPPRAQIKVLAVLDGSTIAPPFTAAGFYEAQDALAQSNRKRLKRNSKKWMALAAITVASILLMLVVIPKVYPSLLPRLAMVKRSVVSQAKAMDTDPTANRLKPSPSTLLTKTTQPVASAIMPSPATPPAADDRATATDQEDVTPPQVESKTMNDQLTAPTRIPHDINAVAKQDAPPSPDFAAASMEGLGNSGGNVVGRVFTSGNKGPKVSVVPPTRVNLSSGVAAGMLLKKTLPVYPAIAKAAHVSGTVVLEATISKAGTIENLHVVTGPIMLQQVATDAVRSWHYRPYLLDGKPVEVDTTVNVVFTLGG